MGAALSHPGFARLSCRMAGGLSPAPVIVGSDGEGHYYMGESLNYMGESLKLVREISYSDEPDQPESLI